jgi:hypothetical protein
MLGRMWRRAAAGKPPYAACRQPCPAASEASVPPSRASIKPMLLEQKVDGFFSQRLGRSSPIQGKQAKLLPSQLVQIDREHPLPGTARSSLCHRSGPDRFSNRDIRRVLRGYSRFYGKQAGAFGHVVMRPFCVLGWACLHVHVWAYLQYHITTYKVDRLPLPPSLVARILGLSTRL